MLSNEHKSIVARFMANITLELVNIATQPMDSAISGTPTGEIRNALTEANIHLMAAQAKLAEVEKLYAAGNVS